MKLLIPCLILVICSFTILRVNEHDLINAVVYVFVGVCGGCLGVALSR